MRFNGYWLEAARREFRNNPQLSASLDCVFGAPRTNNYTKLARTYRRSNFKPDKHYSHLPTVLRLVGNSADSTILDLGCGSGFYTRELAGLGAKKVIGIDNAKPQIELAIGANDPDTVEYRLGDIFTDNLPHADRIVAPYVVNYADNTDVLYRLFEKFYQSLNAGGRLVLVVDLPTKSDLKRFGAVKTALGPKANGTRIRIDLYGPRGGYICPLYCTYFLKETLVSTLRGLGFKKVKWNEAIVSEEGIRKFGAKFWNGYIEDPQVGYLTAEK